MDERIMPETDGLVIQTFAFASYTTAWDTIQRVANYFRLWQDENCSSWRDLGLVCHRTRLARLGQEEVELCKNLGEK